MAFIPKPPCLGADLVGKIEAGIPEDDPRNPAVVADLVGDNVGDCAGRGADSFFESTAAENIGAMILGVALLPTFGIQGIMFPLVARALGLIASIIAIMTVRGAEDEDPMASLNRGYYVATGLATVGFLLATWQMLGDYWFWFFLAGLTGIITSLLFVYVTQHTPEYRYRPAAPSLNPQADDNHHWLCRILFDRVAHTDHLCGAAVFLLLWHLEGDRCRGIPSVGFYDHGDAGHLRLYSGHGYVGPITDNAGIYVVRRFARRRSTGCRRSTTKALTRGARDRSAALAAFLLFSAYMNEVTALTGHVFAVVNLAKVHVFVGGLLGAMLVSAGLIVWFGQWPIT